MFLFDEQHFNMEETKWEGSFSSAVAVVPPHIWPKRAKKNT